jgi:anti-sigma factor RsiW
MGDLHCKWVRDRLPLLAGGELLGLDRRRVERHLIGCARCRQDREALGQALDVLHAAATRSPADPDAPSLWPALARQIRESRRPAPASALAWPRFVLWPAFGLGFGLLVALCAALVSGARATPTVRLASIAKARPQVRWPIARPVAPAPAPKMVERPAPIRELPGSVDEPSVVESDPPSQLVYDLDHGMPMPPADSRDLRQPTY